MNFYNFFKSNRIMKALMVMAFLFAFGGAQVSAQSYCDIEFSYTCDEYISNVTLGDIDNTTTCPTGNTYVDYTAQSTSLTPAESYTLYVSVGDDYGSSDNLNAYIDWNGDGDWSDPGEKLLATDTDASVNSAVDIPIAFTVPATATVGETRMRVVLSYSNATDPCGSLSWGEAEDYTVNIQPASDMAYTSSTTEQASTLPLAPGMTDKEILRVEVEMTGAENPLNATNMVFTTDGTTDVTDIDNATLYYTGTDDYLYTDNAMGQYGDPNGTFAISFNQQLEAGTNYFWLVYDVADDASTGNVLDATCTTVTVDGTDYTPDVTAPDGSREIMDYFSGNYPIGAAGSAYTSIADILADIGAVGLNGNTNIILDGVYNEYDRLQILPWYNHEGTYTLKITVAQGGSAVVNCYGGHEAIVILGVENFEIDGNNPSSTGASTPRNLTFKNKVQYDASSGFENGIAIAAGADGVSIKNTNFENFSNESNYVGLVDGSNDITFDNCSFAGGYYGLVVQNSSTEVEILNSSIGTNDEDNTITHYGIRVDNSEDFKISGNDINGINNYTYPSPTSIYCMYIYYSYDGEISNNKIHNITQHDDSYAYLYGMRLYSNSSAADLDLDVFNNALYDFNGDDVRYLYGVYSYYGGGVNFYHNTFNFDNGVNVDYGRALYFSGYSGMTPWTIKNNVFNFQPNMNTGGNYRRMYYGSTDMTSFTIDYNRYYMPIETDDDFAYYKLGSSYDYAHSWSDWQDDTDFDANSTFGMTSFASDGCHISGDAIGSDDYQVSTVSGVSSDIDGENRLSSNNYIGCDNVYPTTEWTTDLSDANTCYESSFSWNVLANISGYEDGVERYVTNPPFEYTWYFEGTRVDASNANYELDGGTLTIPYAEQLFAGDYYVKAEMPGADNIYTYEAELFVEYPLSIVTQPPTVVEQCLDGDDPRAYVTAEFNGTIMGYQWQKHDGMDWVDVPGQTTPTLEIIVDDPEENSGDYRLVAYGPGNCGPAELATDASIVDISLPLTNLQNHLPEGFNPGYVCTGTDIALSASADGTILGFQWQKKSGNMWMDIDPMANSTANTPNLVMTDVDLDYSGEYRCMIYGSTQCTEPEKATDPINIKVWPLFDIAYQPASQTVCVGETMVFNVIPEGKVLEYHWMRDGELLNVEDYPTADEPLLEITDVELNQSGEYSCLLTIEDCRGVSQIESESAKAYIMPETEIIYLPYPITYAEPGSTVTWEVIAFMKGLTAPWFKDRYQWYRYDSFLGEGVPLENNEKYSGAQSSILTISDIGTGDYTTGADDYYYVEVEGQCGLVNSANLENNRGKLQIMEPPMIVVNTQPADLSGCLNGQVSLHVDAAIDPQVVGPMLTYQWYHDGMMVMNDFPRVTGANDATLVIDGLMNDDAGEYYCEISTMNSPNIEAVDSDVATLTVDLPPTIETQPTAQSVETGKELTLTVDATSTLPLTYQWYKDGVEILDATEATYYVAAVDATYAGLYKVEVTNDCGVLFSDEVEVTITKVNMSSVDEENAIGFGLNEPQPNPTSTATEVSFEIGDAGYVELSLVDAAGREVSKLISTTYAAGAHSIEIDIDELSLTSGVYYLQLTSNGMTSTKQLVVIK